MTEYQDAEFAATPTSASQDLNVSGTKLSLRISAPFVWVYHKFFFPREHVAWVDKQPPAPSFEITPEKRVDILLALMNNIRNSIHHWEDRIFQAAFLSSAAILSAVAFFLQHQPTLGRYSSTVAVAVFAFGVLTSIYLILGTKAHADNGVLLVKIEAALGLCTESFYIQGSPFFGYSGRWVRNWRALLLFIVHLFILVFSMRTIFF